MISTPIALRLCGFLYIFILITNAASVGLGNRTGETDSAAMLATWKGVYKSGGFSLFAGGAILVIFLLSGTQSDADGGWGLCAGDASLGRGCDGCLSADPRRKRRVSDPI
jgi:hypothetical protein